MKIGHNRWRPHFYAKAVGRLACALLPAVALAPNAAWAQAAPIMLELNRLEAREASCRVWVVVKNPDKDSLDPVKLDVVLFGRDGVAGRRLAVDIGPLPAGRTVVRLFDVPAQSCEGIGQMLMNDVLACGTTDLPQRNACADRLVPASRVPGVAFEK